MPTGYNLLDISFLDLAYPLYPTITVPCCVCPPGTTYLTFLFLILPIHSILASQYHAVYAHQVQRTWQFFSWSCLSTLSYHHSTMLCTLTRYNLLDISFLDLACPLYPSTTVPCCVRSPGTTYLTFLFLILPIHYILASEYRAVYAHQVQLTWQFSSWSCLSTLS